MRIYQIVRQRDCVILATFTADEKAKMDPLVIVKSAARGYSIVARNEHEHVRGPEQWESLVRQVVAEDRGGDTTVWPEV